MCSVACHMPQWQGAEMGSLYCCWYSKITGVFASLPWKKNCWGEEDADPQHFGWDHDMSVPRRLMYGHYHRLMWELRMEDTASFYNFMRMEPQMFDKLVDRLSPRITVQDTNWRKALEPGLNVAVTLRYLAPGDRYSSLSYNFRVSRHTIAKFIPQVCQAIVNEYKNWWPFTSVAIALRYRCFSRPYRSSKFR